MRTYLIQINDNQARVIATLLAQHRGQKASDITVVAPTDGLDLGSADPDYLWRMLQIVLSGSDSEHAG